MIDQVATPTPTIAAIEPMMIIAVFIGLILKLESIA